MPLQLPEYNQRLGHRVDLVLVLLLFFASLVLVPGEILVRQINTNTQNSETWIVRGLATYDFTSSNPPVFYFQCTSPTDSQDSVSWSKVEGSLGNTQVVITNGIELRINPPIAGDAGTYVCSNSMESVQFVLTGKNPASKAVNPQQSAYTGDGTVINMYASTLSPLSEGLITWTLNGNPLTDGVFTNTKTTLNISNVQPSDAGVYRLTIMVNGKVNSSTTTLTVLALPTTPEQVTIHTNTYTNETIGNISWTESTVDSSVGGMKYRIVISSSALEQDIIMESTSNSVMVEGLVPSDDQYCVVVTAIDGNGRSSNDTLPTCFIFNVPSPVDDVEATHSLMTPNSPQAQVIVTWNTSMVTMPSNVAMPDMNGYIVTISSTNYSTYSGLLPTTTFNHTFTGVPVGSNYTVTVIVVNAVGNSEAVSEEIFLPPLMMPDVSSTTVSEYSSSVAIPISDIPSPSPDPSHHIIISSSPPLRPSQSMDCINCITITTTYVTLRPPQPNTPSHTEDIYTRVIPTDIVLCSTSGIRIDRGGVPTSCIMPDPSKIIDGISSSIPGQSVSVVVLFVTVLSTLVYLTIGLLLL